MAEYTSNMGPVVEDPAQMDAMVDGTLIKRRGRNVVVDFAPGTSRRTGRDDDEDHSKNLVDELEEGQRTELMHKVIEQVEADLNSRADWQSRVDQAMDLLGLRNKPRDDAVFEGASAVTHPLIAEACVQFQARAIEEVFPSDGPCKTKIVGTADEEKVEQAERVKDHMNYQMVEEDEAYFWHVDQMLFYLPLAGSSFKKTYYDDISDMNISRLVQAGDFIVPYTCTDLRTATRYTHRMKKTEQDMKRLISAGFYKEYELVEADGGIDVDEVTREDDMRDEADDRQSSLHQDDHIYELFEMHCDLELDMDQKNSKYLKDKQKEIGHPLPYIVTVDKTSMEMIGLRRNWKEKDEKFTKRVWFTHYKYLPGLGFYGFGLLHLIGSVSESTTGTLRALLDAAAFANLQGGFMSQDIALNPEDMAIAPGIWKRVNATGEEMAKSFYTPPFKEPSTALAQLFEKLEQAGRRFASITEENVGDAPNTGPVGTTIALIEQANKVFSGVHRRLHRAQAEEFTLRAELNAEFLDERYPYEVEGEEKVVMRADYDGRVDVIPVSDPNVVSSTQRIAQASAMIDVAERFPQKVSLDVALKRFFKAIKVPEPEELLLGEQETMRMDPIAENMRMMTGSGAKAFVEQDHDSHIQVHEAMLAGLDTEGLAIVAPAVQAHLQEHYAYKYYNEMNAQLGGQLPPPTFMDKNEDTEELPLETDWLIAQAAAAVGPIQIMPPEEPQPGDQEAFQAEEARKQQAWEAEESRKEQSFQAEQRRGDAKAEYEADRDLGKSLSEEIRKSEEAEREAAQQQQREQRQTPRERRLARDRGEEQ